MSRHDLVRALDAEKELALVQQERSMLLEANGHLQNRLMEAVQDLYILQKEFNALTAAMIGAASAYRKHAARSKTISPRAVSDPFYRTRVKDLDRAVEQAVKFTKSEET